MAQRIFLAPAKARQWLAERDIETTYATGANVARTNNKRQFYDAAFGDVIDQLAAGETIHDDPTPVHDNADPDNPVLLGWNATILFDETIPELRGGIAEIEVKTKAFIFFAVYLIDTTLAKMNAINDALQAHAPYLGEVTQGITANSATKNALLADIITWRDQALVDGQTGLAAGLDTFHTAVQGVTNLSEFRQVMRDALGITQADIDRVQIGQPEEA
jgi:hypothetical protein